MTSLTPEIPGVPSRTLHGIGCILLGMCLFAGQDAMMKSLLGAYPVWVLMFVRSCVAVAVLVPLILALGGSHRLITPHWRLHLLRSALFSVGFSLFYAAFPFMGLAEVTTIFFSAPLMIALMAALLLKETLGPHRIAALITGFAGVVIAMNPGGAGFTWVAVLPVVCAAFYAASQILARRIGDHESSLTVGLWTLTFAGPIVLGMGFALNQLVTFGPEFAHLRWGLPEGGISGDGPELLLLGVAGMAGYTILSRAYQVADASVIAPFDYSYLPIAAVMAWLLWGEVPALTTFVGMVLIVASGLYIALRELRAARLEGAPTMVADTVTAPGAYAARGSEEDGPS
jgi:drug/metabolite transporter (DMT)-like permease